jgi:acetyl esterase/lipase
VGLLVVGSCALLLAGNALWPRRAPPELGMVSFFAGWLTSELALHLLLWLTLVVALFLRAGALATWAGQLGLGLSLAAAGLLLWSSLLSARCRVIVDNAVARLPSLPRSFEWRQLLLPIPVTHPEVERVADVTYFEDDEWRLRLDVFRPKNKKTGDAASSRPAVIYCHGGAWIIGHRRFQGLPTLHRLAARGWICFSIQYRLSPRATFPDHIVDVKRAIAWVREHADEWGVDPSCIVVAGGSAGAHLASLAALTPNHAAWQPGFEDADTSVQGCIAYYGVYDFTDRFGHWPRGGLRMILERYVFKARLKEARARFEAASPLSHAGPHAPPFLVAHGTHDTVVPVEEARQFVAALGDRCVYLEVPGAQHAFEIFPSLRTLAILDGVERFATSLYASKKAGISTPSRAN